MGNELIYIVECKMFAFFEPIAAFNCLDACRRYAQQCADANHKRGTPLHYRVRYGSHTIHIETDPSA